MPDSLILAATMNTDRAREDRERASQLFPIGTKVGHLDQQWPKGIYAVVVSHVDGDCLVKFPGWTNVALQFKCGVLRSADEAELAWQPAIGDTAKAPLKITSRLVQVMLHHQALGALRTPSMPARPPSSLRVRCADGLSFSIRSPARNCQAGERLFLIEPGDKMAFPPRRYGLAMRQ
jgi:hypothetical protein